MNASTEETLWKSSRHAKQFQHPSTVTSPPPWPQVPHNYLLSRLFPSSFPPKHLLWLIHIHDLTGLSYISHTRSYFCVGRDVSQQQLIWTLALTPPVLEFAQSRCALHDWSSYPKHTSLEEEREEGSERWMNVQVRALRRFGQSVNVSTMPSD